MKTNLLFLAVFLSTQLSFATDEKALFAGGCFWCMEAPFEKVTGVKSAISGYSGGVKKSPSYKEISSGKTRHAEVVQITFDPKIVSYKKLLDIFWRQIDPTTPNKQFVDEGPQYRSAIFYFSPEQKKAAESSKVFWNKEGVFKKPIVTEITAAGPFYPAEEYHQDYYKKNSIKYKYYRYRSGRDQYLEKTWKNYKPKNARYMRPPVKKLKNKLTKLQFQVTQHEATEPPYKNTYWDNKKPGIYVDVVSGEPLFSSTDKYDSKTGWPSFTKPLKPELVVEKEDNSLFSKRIELKSKYAASHLGHLFNDGPAPRGLRYCINSAALKFIPAKELNQQGYGEFAYLFTPTKKK